MVEDECHADHNNGAFLETRSLAVVVSQAAMRETHILRVCSAVMQLLCHSMETSLASQKNAEVARRLAVVEDGLDSAAWFGAWAEQVVVGVGCSD